MANSESGRREYQPVEVGNYWMFMDLMGQIQGLIDKRTRKPGGWNENARQLLKEMEEFSPLYEKDQYSEKEGKPVAFILKAIKLIKDFPKYDEILEEDIIQRINNYSGSLQ
jgi:hypothetical protein